MIALGIQSSWEKSHRQALLPLLALVVYDISSALGGFSGQRFFLPVDWIGYFYFCVGAVWLCASILRLIGWQLPRILFSRWPEAAGSTFRSAPRHKLLLGCTAALVLAAGLIYPLIQVVVPIRYSQDEPEKSVSVLTSLARSTLNQAEQAQFEKLIARPDVEILHGVALYPQEIQSIDESEGKIPTDNEVEFPYLSFNLLGARQVIVHQPVANGPIKLAHASEVIVAGWESQGIFHGFLTALPTQGEFYFSPGLRN
jgi:hypothetical protein